MSDPAAPYTAPTYATGNALKRKLGEGQLATAISLRQARTVDIGMMMKTVGFDSLYVDMEHSSISVDATSQICTAALSAGITPLVRVPSGDAAGIARCLDGGALGVIVPQVRSVEDARAIVTAARYAPVGERSVSSALPHLRFASAPLAEAVNELNEATLVVAMVETTDALADIGSIAAVEGLDMLLIGVNDLTTELGVPGQYRHPTAVEAYDRVIDACGRSGKHAGIAGLNGHPDVMRHVIDRGVRFVSVGTDLGCLLNGARQALDNLARLTDPSRDGVS